MLGVITGVRHHLIPPLYINSVLFTPVRNIVLDLITDKAHLVANK